MNAPGCLLWTDIIVTIPTTVLADGTASAQISIPTFTVGRRFTGTWVCIDPAANPLGLVTSNYAKLLIGF